MKSALLVCLFVCSAFAAAHEAIEPAPEVLGNYESTARSRELQLRGTSMDMEIEASLPKLHREGRFHALRKISQLGRISYEALRFEGDRSVERDVIARYLTAESEAQSANAPSLGVNRKNYKFHFKGVSELSGRKAYVFRLTPRQRRVGLYKGEIWIDAKTSMPLRESGYFVKNPSIFLRRVSFVRDYKIQNDVSVPQHIESVIDTYLVGRAEMHVDYSNVSFSNDSAPLRSAAVTPVSLQ